MNCVKEFQQRAYEHTAESVPRARAFVTEVLAEVLDSGRLADARSAVTELVANALEHAHGRFCVRVDIEPEAVGVHVVDSGGASTVPHFEEVTCDSEGGRGLRLVAGLTDAHGAARAYLCEACDALPTIPADGWCCWFRISRPDLTTRETA